MKTIFVLGVFGLVVFGLVGCISIATTSASLAAPELGIVFDADLKIVGLVANSAAEQTGVQVGDRIVKIRNVTVTSPKQARKIFENGNLDQPISFVLERQGQPITLELLPKPSVGHPGAPTSTPAPQDVFFF